MADTTVAFIGIRINVDDGDLEALEARSHPVILGARDAGLQHYWGNFGAPGNRYFIFVGKSLGKLGVEDRAEVQLSIEEFTKACADVGDRLSRLGFLAAPSLFLQLQPDS